MNPSSNDNKMTTTTTVVNNSLHQRAVEHPYLLLSSISVGMYQLTAREDFPMPDMGAFYVHVLAHMVYERGLQCRET